MTELNGLRNDIDEVDRLIVALFEERMALSRSVAAYKKARGLAVFDAVRESQVLESRAQMLKDKSLDAALRDFYAHLLALSRLEQTRLMEDSENA